MKGDYKHFVDFIRDKCKIFINDNSDNVKIEDFINFLTENSHISVYYYVLFDFMNYFYSKKEYASEKSN